jgi:membrane-bound serine protease (ClpP class)
MRLFSHIIPVLIFLSSLLFSQDNKIIVLTADCAVHPALDDYIHAGIEKAEETNAECLILQLNTPGGLLSSTRSIVQELLQSKIPIIVYVYPQGSQAASAGVFITLAANIAVMAPGTNIGAAHPVTLQGAQDSIMMEKATNDASAFIRSISEKRKRNVAWSEDAVRKSLSITEKEALELNVIDFIAKDIDELLIQINGQEVETSEGVKKLATVNSQLVYLDMTIAQKLLSIISNPNIAYILLMLGIYGLFFELYSPGAIFPGVVGAICIILAFYSMNTLPINYAGLALIFLSIVLFILEIKIISHGLLSIGGVISLLLGSLMLINPESLLETMEISMELIIFIIVLTTLFLLVVITLGIKAQKRKPVTGVEGLIGEKGIAITDLHPDGEIQVHGEYWNAEGIDPDIVQGDEIEVIEINNLKLTVKKVDGS